MSSLETFNQALTSGAADFGIPITDQQLRLFSLHYSLLLTHRTHRLTTITDPAHAAIKHFLDSLTALLLREIQPGERVADIGSGAGFPGLVLAVARPHASYTLVESNLKRAAFLREATAYLGLPNVEVIPDRAETLGRSQESPIAAPFRARDGGSITVHLCSSADGRPSPTHRESYDLVIARALAPLPVLLEYCLPLVRLEGDCLALKGPGGEAELARSHHALTTLGGHLQATRNLSLPSGMGDRLLILVRKVSPTPDRYPRRPGVAAKRPL
jgi:16S rRNA (guanine527-N7)-methyltransferase